MAAHHQHPPSGGGRKKSKLFSRWLPWRSGSAAAGAAAVSAAAAAVSASSSAAASGAAASVASSAGASLSTSSASPGSSTRQAQSNTVRRTSPVDSNLGDEPPDDRLPTPPPSPPPPLTPLTPLTPLAPLAPLAPLTPLLDTASRRQRFHAGVGGSLKLARRFKPNPTLTPDGDDYDQLFTKVPLPPPIFATLDTDGDGGARTADADRCKEELGALRNLATELHAALRRSEDENAVLKARLQTLDDFGLASAGTALEPLEKLDQLIDELRDMAWGGAGDEWAPPAPSSASASPASQRRNLRYLTRVLLHRQAEIRRLEHELTATQTELLFVGVELDEVRRCLHRLQQRLLYAQEELEVARHDAIQASVGKQRLMQELQTTRGLLMRCWSRVRVLERQQSLLQPSPP